MPIGWTERYYKDKLFAFFLDMGWITPKDSNESKVLVIPFIQVLAEYFQRSLDQEEVCMDRERTSVLFSMQLANGDNRSQFSYTFFKMQSAKELIAVSKKLASSDFLLVPSVGDTTSIDLANLEDVIYYAVKRILARIQQEGSKDPQCMSDANRPKWDEPAWNIAYTIPIAHKMMLVGQCFAENVAEYSFSDMDLEREQLQDLKNWTWAQLIEAVF
ncbi:hypothetical protein MBANPS3_011297 [Mucor bainieri]